MIKVEDDDCVSWSQSEPDSEYKNLKRAFYFLFDSVCSQLIQNRSKPDGVQFKLCKRLKVFLLFISRKFLS